MFEYIVRTYLTIISILVLVAIRFTSTTPPEVWSSVDVYKGIDFAITCCISLLNFVNLFHLLRNKIVGSVVTTTTT